MSGVARGMGRLLHAAAKVTLLKTNVLVVVGFIGFAAGLTGGLSCGTATNCTVANCNGCCGDDGTCHSGATAAMCGSNGGTCSACSDTQACSNGSCVASGNGGGTASNGGGTNGGGSSSNGGGTSGNGGGTSSNGGGSTSNGGGTHAGGGTASSGGGTASNGGGTASSGGGTASSGGGTGTGGGTSANCPTVTVAEGFNNVANQNTCVTISGAVVIAASTPFMSTTSTCVGNAMEETFYIQDPGGSIGIGVFKSCKDNVTALPVVGDIVTVSGRLAVFDGSLQISSSTKYSTVLTLTDTGSGGHATNAYTPAGTPLAVTAGNEAGYAHDASGGNPHPDQIGMALHFANVTFGSRTPAGFVSTGSDGGGITPAGFSLTNGIWVDDSLVYYDCLKPLGADAGLALPNGVTGVWDRYVDYYGTNTPIPVLVPMTCSDIQ